MKYLGLLLLTIGSWIAIANLSTIAFDPATNLFAENYYSSEFEQLQLKAHPLPDSLTQWQDSSGDYFSEIKPIDPIGYLIWSSFPINVYIEQADTNRGESFETKALETWSSFVLAAVEDWNSYLPLEVVDDPEIADITMWRRRPPLRFSESGELLPARSAQTQYELYVQESDNSPGILLHRSIIFLSPTQTGSYIQAAARHELGHGLGIWGHSRVQSDVMYASQVGNSPTISPRDVNTLRLVYQQPTLLGWPVNF